MDDCKRIYEQWDLFARTGAIAELLDLYADDAVFESPLVPAILDQPSGALRGRAELEHFFTEGVRRRPNELVRWHRTGFYLCDGHTLVWEYPRETPHGDQVDLLEFMQIADGRIKTHVVYWGWVGTGLLIRNAVAKAGSAPRA
jgi:hypothetical protein